MFYLYYDEIVSIFKNIEIIFIPDRGLPIGYIKDRCLPMTLPRPISHDQGLPIQRGIEKIGEKFEIS
jgi:hypothetical protein